MKSLIFKDWGIRAMIASNGFWYPKPDSDRAKHYATVNHFKKGVVIDFSPFSVMENMTCPLCSRKINFLEAATEYQNIFKGAWVCWHCEIVYPLKQPHNPSVKKGT